MGNKLIYLLSAFSILLLLSASFAQEMPGPAIPKITVDFPPQNHSSESSYVVFMFTYNGVDENDLQECSVLLGNRTLGAKNVRSGDYTTITIARIPAGEYNWSIKCANYSSIPGTLTLIPPQNNSNEKEPEISAEENASIKNNSAAEENATSLQINKSGAGNFANEKNNMQNLGKEDSKNIFASAIAQNFDAKWILLAAAAILIVGAIYFMLKR